MARINSNRVKVGGMVQLCMDLKPRRTDCDVFINSPIDVTETVKYIDKRKKDGEYITYFHAFLLAIAKTIYNRPKLNRFVKNRHMYEHTNVSISFSAKIEFEDDSEEVMIIIDVAPDDNIDTISKKIGEKIKTLRNKEYKIEGANAAMEILGALPNFIRVPIVGFLKWTDEKGILPKSLQEDNLYYASSLVTDIGSLKSDSIHHNNTDFGTASSIMAIGEIRDDLKVVDGKPKVYKACKFGINFDERVADGFYMIKAYKILEYILANPKLLEGRADEIIEIDNKK